MSKKMNTVEGPFGSYDHGAPGAGAKAIVEGTDFPANRIQSEALLEVDKDRHHKAVFFIAGGLATALVMLYLANYV